jgi:hypothetical protein
MRLLFLTLITLVTLTGCGPQETAESTFVDADGYTGATPKEFQDTSDQGPGPSRWIQVMPVVTAFIFLLWRATMGGSKWQPPRSERTGLHARAIGNAGGW